MSDLENKPQISQEEQALRYASICLYGARKWLSAVKDIDSDCAQWHAQINELFLDIESRVNPKDQDDE